MYLMSDVEIVLIPIQIILQMERINIHISYLQGKVLFPYNQLRFTLPTTLQPEKYQNLVGFCTKVTAEMEREGVEAIQGVSKSGTLLRIQRVDPFRSESEQKDPVPKISYNGLAFAKFRIASICKKQGVTMASILICSDQISEQKESQINKKGLMSTLKSKLKLYYECVLKANELDSKKQQLDDQSNMHKIVYQALNDIDIPIVQKITFLQMQNILEKLQILERLLDSKTKNFKGIIGMESSVKQAMLPHRKNTVKDNQLGFSSGAKNEQLASKMKNKNIPEFVKLEIDKQIKNTSFGTDKMVSERYIDTLLNIPWGEYTEDVKDIRLAQKILNADHTGMKEVKERVLEHLAVRFRRGNSNGNVICLHGPPGVGKTSIAKSIAKALGRSFERISLGGMGSESQLRGHRRTYVSALPGVVIRALIKAKSSNPVILLDEIQKLGKGHRGDAENALLQIIDPSQNSSFVDHYIALPVDLSKVMFICTANSLGVSQPLLNRLETIQVPGYSREEKAEIARKHVIPRQLRENAVEGLVYFENSGIETMISYSNELGVRGLERDIAKSCRKIARMGRKEVVNKQWVQQHICAKQTSQLWSGVGVANGMAYTDLGGRVITIEALKFSSAPRQVKVTGQLGQVMKESVEIAISWIRSNFQEMGLFQACKTLQQRSIHLHVPDGSTKKDGPSAGITVLTCLASLILKAAPREFLAMTGEITLSGKVLPVGGVRQKCMAAIYKGIKHIIIPEANLKDIDRLQEEIKKQAVFYGIKEVKEALAIAFPNVFDKLTAKL